MTSQRWPVAAVVVTHSSASLLPEFAATVARAVRACGGIVVVVDSGSPDDTVTAAIEQLPDAEIVALDGNRGFAAGVNAGIHHVDSLGGAEGYWIVNPDVRIDDRSLQHLLDAARDGKVIAVPRLHDGGQLLPSLRRPPSLATTLADAVLGGPRAARLHLPTEVLRDQRLYEGPTEACWATGGALLVPSDCWEAVGDWEESYFMYDEEVDFCLRARLAGWRVRLVPEANAHRLGGADKSAPWAEALIKRNRVRTFRRFSGAVTAAAAAVVEALGQAIRALSGRAEARAALWAVVTAASPEEIMRRYGPAPIPALSSALPAPEIVRSPNGRGRVAGHARG